MSVSNQPIELTEFRQRLKQLEAGLEQVLASDRYRLQRESSKLAGFRRMDARAQQRLERLENAIQQSIEVVEQRRAALPKVSFPAELPISAKAEEIRDALLSHQVIVVAGETGSGKTTQLPKICLEAGRGILGRIGHTQPRRIAARTVAQRIAQELGVGLGEQVGYQVRFTDQVSANTLIKLMTDGILLSETQRDRFLSQYDTLIIDEAHERSLNIDFLLGYLRRLLPKRPDLKVIITSATIDVERFSRHFGDAPIIEVSGRTYPVEVRYRPLTSLEDDGDADLSIQSAILQVVEEIEQEERRQHRLPGDILVFMVGEREIRETSLFLRKAQLAGTEVLPLYARLTAEEQNRIFQPHRGRRIILATNVAETSLTVPGIRYVIDPGLARISRYSYRSKVQRLPIEPISQASANQRKGRSGRVAEGICYRLYSEEDFNNRPEFTDAEILRTNLASVVLQMLHLRLGNIEDFPFVDAPDRRLINDGYKLLEELGAVDSQRQITELGRQMARIPADPRIARMLLESARLGCLREILVIASALAIPDPRERPLDKQQQADERHGVWKDKDSDFLSLVNLWNYFEEQRQELSANQLRTLCKKLFLSFLRMREWRDLHRQLRLICQELGLKENTEPGSFELIHRAILSGYITLIGFQDEKGEYLGTRGRKFFIYPGSGLFKKTPKWVLAAEIVETTKVYARTVARVEPEWIERAAQHLVKRNYLEPHWEKKRGEVVAYEQVSLYGVVLVSRRKVSFGRIDPVLSRELFIRHGLVEGELNTRADFFHHNQQQIHQVDELESKSRRRDLLVDPEVLFQFYDERIPAEIVSARHFEAWQKKLDEAQRAALRLRREDVLQGGGTEQIEEQFPDTLTWQGASFRLEYRFEPGHPEDGMSVLVPISALKQLPVDRLQWLVPGLLRDKAIALVKALPKSLRRNFVPVPEFVDAALQALVAVDEPLTEHLGQQLHRMTGVRIPHEAWDEASLEPFLRMNIKVVDEEGKMIAQGRSYHDLMERLGDRAASQPLAKVSVLPEQSGITQWDFGDLPDVVEMTQAGAKTLWYPALVDEGSSVRRTLLVDSKQAMALSRRGIARLIRLRLAQQEKYLHKNLPHLKEMGLYYAPIGQLSRLLDDLLTAVFQTVFLADGLPRTRTEFDHCVEQGRGRLVETANRIAELVHQALKEYHEIARRLKGKVSLALALPMADVKRQLDGLVYDGFISDTPLEWLEQYPRYFKALDMRLEKMPLQLQKERLFLGFMDECLEQYHQRKEKLERQAIYDEELELYRWMLEEYRVSYFAQALGTKMPVSEKRLERQWEKVRR